MIAKLAPFCFGIAVFCCTALWSTWGRADRAVPRSSYFSAFAPYERGDYQRAIRSFRGAARSGIRSSEGRWIDSICYHTMIGECYYHTGDYKQALLQYESALNLLIAHANWMRRLEFPAAIERDATQPVFPWGKSARRSIKGRIPDVILSRQGQINQPGVLQRGGALVRPFLYPVRAREIVRCAVMALKRRREILGPTCRHFPFSAKLVEALQTRPAPANHWSQGWISAQLGLALAGAGEPSAIAELKNSLVISGGFDHTVTGIVLLALGRLALESGNRQEAGRYFWEATFAGAAFRQDDVIEEAFRLAVMVNLAEGGKSLVGPLTAAAAWAKKEGSRPLQASLLLLAAESAAHHGQTAQAVVLLAEAGALINRRRMSSARIGVRFDYVSAIVVAAQGKLAQGAVIAPRAVRRQVVVSPRLFQINTADELFVKGQVSPRIANELFSVVLRPPAATDWMLDPLDTLAVQAAPQASAMEHWLQTALARKNTKQAYEISELIRRGRFYRSLPLAGRLLALRWIVGAPKEALDEKSILQRQDLLAKNRTLADLSRKVEQAQTALRAMPLAPDNRDDLQRQAQRLTELENLGEAQESILLGLALRRQAAEFAFPPLTPLAQLQKRLSPGQIIVAYLAIGRKVFVFQLDSKKLEVSELKKTRGVKQRIAALLKRMGHHNKNLVITSKDLVDDSWKKPAAELAQILLNNRGDLIGQYKELIIVPDGLLWHLPFELLPAPNAEGNRDASAPLISKVRIRYAPTISLAVPDHRRVRPNPRMAVICSKLFPRDADHLLGKAEEDLLSAAPTAEFLKTKLPSTSASLATVCDVLATLGDLSNAHGDPSQLSPMLLDAKRAGSRLSDWLKMPWGGPALVILPGFHTAAEESLKNGGDGNEVFLTVCGFMATGARTVLLSRWVTGGRTSVQLTEQFLRDLPQTTASDAWRKSVQQTMSSKVVTVDEPRVDLKRGARKDAASDFEAKHPFFWSGYLLVDTGAAPVK